MCAMRTVLRMNGRASPDALWGLYSVNSKQPSKCEVDVEVQSAAASSAQQRRRLLCDIIIPHLKFTCHPEVGVD